MMALVATHLERINAHHSRHPPTTVLDPNDGQIGISASCGILTRRRSSQLLTDRVKPAHRWT